ncbi:MAG: HEPN domain-containing protein [Spirochaetales bacterium]|nr:HEPN domain-containing protein [Spirochaetales bacterium]MCF7939195.1 HEPN domain-containing protein [Spirochaetales bacterium]
MSLEAEDKKSLSDIRFEKAKEFLHDAEANLSESRLKTSINRSYYAVLNAVRSLLVLEGMTPESHSGAVTSLSLRFIKTGLLPVETIKAMKILLSRRTDVDYGDFDTIDNADAEDSLKKARTILEQIDAVRKELKRDL